MAADSGRLVDVRGLHPVDAQGRVYAENGSGLLVTHDLVLTAAHVVFDGDTPLPVRLRFVSSGDPVDGEVVWPLPRGGIDAALVRIVASSPVPPGSQPVRWARFTGREARRRVDAAGYPAVMREGDERIAFQLSGHVNPQSALTAGRYVVKVDERPANVGSPWSGMSGAALMSGGTLVGVLVIDTPGFDRDGSQPSPPRPSSRTPKRARCSGSPRPWVPPSSIRCWPGLRRHTAPFPGRSSCVPTRGSSIFSGETASSTSSRSGADRRPHSKPGSWSALVVEARRGWAIS